MYQRFVNIQSYSLDDLMNGPVKEALGVNVTHGEHSGTVFVNLQEDFMKPVIDIGII